MLKSVIYGLFMLILRLVWLLTRYNNIHCFCIYNYSLTNYYLFPNPKQRFSYKQSCGHACFTAGRTAEFFTCQSSFFEEESQLFVTALGLKSSIIRYLQNSRKRNKKSQKYALCVTKYFKLHCVLCAARGKKLLVPEAGPIPKKVQDVLLHWHPASIPRSTSLHWTANTSF